METADLRRHIPALDAQRRCEPLLRVEVAPLREQLLARLKVLGVDIPPHLVRIDEPRQRGAVAAQDPHRLRVELDAAPALAVVPIAVLLVPTRLVTPSGIALLGLLVFHARESFHHRAHALRERLPAREDIVRIALLRVAVQPTDQVAVQRADARGLAGVLPPAVVGTRGGLGILG